jgi:ERCC4-related helicase
MSAQTSYAPGSRVRVRGEEWVVEKSLPVRGKRGLAHAVHVRGLTELVRHHQAIFVDDIDTIEPLRPEDTKLVADPSPEYRQTRLFLETLLRRTPPTDDRVHVGHRAAIDAMAYQLVPARKALGELRQRILIADGVGLGKTIEVGILLSELIKRGRGRRILVVAIRSMLAQFQQELWVRFSLPLVRLDSEGIRRVHAKIPSNKNPFSYFDRAIISVDTLKNDGRYRAWLEQTRWDAIVVDECHNVANRGSQREALARLLAATCDTLILTSATPHNGRPESFANLMRMLDPTAIADERDFDHEDVEHLFVRRFKKDVEAEAGRSFTEREIHRREVQASPAEEAALAALRGLELHNLGRTRNDVDRLFPWTLVKAFLSSPHACLESIDERLDRVDRALADDHPYAERLEKDAETLRELRARVEPCLGDFRKLGQLVRDLRAIGFDGGPKSPRVIIFSERIRTLEMLREELARTFDVPADDGPIAVFDASNLSDVEQGKLIESFGKKDSRLRLLLASDAASEGVNLHYFCHHLFHFDVPWSLIRIEQRMGRIDRYGQKETPQLYYLLTKTDEEGADQLVVRRLIDKEQQVHQNLGDAGVVLGLYDAQAEDEEVTSAVAEGRSVYEAIPEEPRGIAAAEPSNDGGGVDLLALLAQVQAEAPTAEPVAEATAPTKTLFPDDYGFTRTALAAVEDHPVTGEERLTWETDDAHQLVKVYAPESFTRWREPFMPEEAVPGRQGSKGREPYRLVADRGVVTEQIQAARDNEGEWPAYHLLWEQHPLMEWLLDSLAAVYARNEAPVLLAPDLGKHRGVYLFTSLVSNENSQPVLASWFGVQMRAVAEGSGASGKAEGIVELDELLELTGLSRGLTNPGGEPPLREALQRFVPEAVRHAREHVHAAYEAELGQLRRQVRKPARRLAKWQQRSRALIDAQEARLRARNGGTVPKLHQGRLEERRRHVQRFVADQQRWQRTLVRHGEPFVRLAAVFTGGA